MRGNFVENELIIRTSPSIVEKNRTDVPGGDRGPVNALRLANRTKMRNGAMACSSLLLGILSKEFHSDGSLIDLETRCFAAVANLFFYLPYIV